MISTAPLWRRIQRQNFTRMDALADFLELSPAQRALLWDKPRFPLNLPLRLARKIVKKTLNDPILRQFVPLCEETSSPAHFLADPVGDKASRKCSKFLHKYHGRALLLATSACAMHCRYCFRQQFPYDTSPPLFTSEIAAIQADSSLEEIILSGGDPLSLSNEALRSLFSSLALAKHLKRIRFHTRFPLGIPERIDEEFLTLLASHPCQIFFVIHCNHPEELDPDVLSALQSIGNLGIPLLNQSVLLKGVNDDEETLLTLCKTLIDAGILPYYLHLLDRVEGSAHFEVSEKRGIELIAYLQKHLSGYGVPRLVKEEAGKPSKTSVSSSLLDS